MSPGQRHCGGPARAMRGFWNPPGPDVRVPGSPEPEPRSRASDGPEHQSRLLSQRQGRQGEIKTSKLTVVLVKLFAMCGVPEG